jgi:hypothetical protein
MHHPNLVRSLLVPVGIGLLFVAGCSEQTVNLSGKLVLPSKIKLVESDAVTLAFAPEGTAGKAAIGLVSNGDQTFTVKDITPGKYKITFGVTPYPDQKKRIPLVEPLNTKFDMKASPLKYEVTAEPNQSITIDLEKGTVERVKS